MSKWRHNQLSGWKRISSEEKMHIRTDKGDGGFFDWKGLVHYELFPCGQTVNKELYWKFSRCMKNIIYRKTPDYEKIRVGFTSLQCASSCVTLLSVIISKRWNNYPAPPTLPFQIWSQQTFPCLQNWRWSWKEAVLNHNEKIQYNSFMPSKKMRYRKCFKMEEILGEMYCQQRNFSEMDKLNNVVIKLIH